MLDDRSIDAPMEENAKRQLYCRILRMNVLERWSPAKFSRLAKKGGGFLRGGSRTLPPLQQRL